MEADISLFRRNNVLIDTGLRGKDTNGGQT